MCFPSGAALPAETWWTYAVDRSRGHGAQFDTLAVTEFFCSAVSKYREPLAAEGEVTILRYVQPRHRKLVIARVRQIPSILERPVAGENPPADKQWQGTSVVLEVAEHVSTAGHRLVWQAAAETTYLIDQFRGEVTNGERPAADV